MKKYDIMSKAACRATAASLETGAGLASSWPADIPSSEVGSHGFSSINIALKLSRQISKLCNSEGLLVEILYLNSPVAYCHLCTKAPSFPMALGLGKLDQCHYCATQLHSYVVCLRGQIQNLREVVCGLSKAAIPSEASSR